MKDFKKNFFFPKLQTDLTKCFISFSGHSGLPGMPLMSLGLRVPQGLPLSHASLKVAFRGLERPLTLTHSSAPGGLPGSPPCFLLFARLPDFPVESLGPDSLSILLAGILQQEIDHIQDCLFKWGLGGILLGTSTGDFLPGPLPI